MSYLKRYVALFLGVGALFLWAGSLEGWAAWAVRLGAVGLGAGLAAWWSLGPWRNLTEAVRRIQADDYGARLDDVTPGDLRKPATAFNAMADGLETLRRLAEERERRFQAVLAAGGRAIILMDREGRILLSGPATPKLFPRFRDDAMLTSLGLPGLSQLVEESLADRQAREATFSESEMGRGRVFWAKIVPLEDGSVVVILDEITTQARLDQLKADLVANVSHELRTPLTAMSALLETLEDPGLTADQKADFETRLRRQLGRMEALVEDLLSLSRLEGNQVALRREPVELASAVQEVFSSLAPLAESGAVTLRSSVPEELTLATDRNLLEMVLKNLVDNGIRYNRRGGSVAVEAVQRDGKIIFSVSDTGEGIPEPHLDRIFERFYRVDPHRSREKGGTGLGLAIVKHGVAQLGGQVTVESTVGVGTTFRVELPA
jgi:two-component system, OmpR family, phosphate regulon sensor histidine kinase PhoR